MKLIARVKKWLLEPEVKVLHVGTVLGDGRTLFEKMQDARIQQDADSLMDVMHKEFSRP